MAHTSMQISERWMDPHFKFYVNRVRDREKHLLTKNNLGDEYLGACLDYIRWGGQMTVMYEKGTKEMIAFIQEWIKKNEGNLIWHEDPPPSNFALPYVKRDVCPRDDKHSKNPIKFRAIDGTIRCGYTIVEKFKPSFHHSYKTFDEHSQSKRKEFIEDAPVLEIPDDAYDDQTGDIRSEWKEEYDTYQREKKTFDKEEPTVVVKQVCGAILSDESVILSLEEILDRLNLNKSHETVYCDGKRRGFVPIWERPKCKLHPEDESCEGHDLPPKQTVHPFDGWCLAWYVQKWYEQAPGKAPFFKPKNANAQARNALIEELKAHAVFAS